MRYHIHKLLQRRLRRLAYEHAGLALPLLVITLLPEIRDEELPFPIISSDLQDIQALEQSDDALDFDRELRRKLLAEYKRLLGLCRLLKQAKSKEDLERIQRALA